MKRPGVENEPITKVDLVDILNDDIFVTTS
jgi:hypothetical protein